MDRTGPRTDALDSGARFHPHLHAILTGGGWDAAGQWRSVFGWDRPVLRELFQVEVFRFLRHVGWHPGEPAPDLIRRAPPAMLKVAESPPKT